MAEVFFWGGGLAVLSFLALDSNSVWNVLFTKAIPNPFPCPY